MVKIYLTRVSVCLFPKSISIGKQRHYNREIIHHLHVTLCLSNILFKLWHCHQEHESAIIFSMDTDSSYCYLEKIPFKLSALKKTSIPLPESFNFLCSKRASAWGSFDCYAYTPILNMQVSCVLAVTHFVPTGLTHSPLKHL